MADESDVEAALANAVAQALYPAGSSEGSVTGGVFRIYRGWPSNTALEADLAGAISHVSVCAVTGSASPVDQYPAVWELSARVAPGLSISVAEGVVTLSGAATQGQLAGVLVDDAAFAYRTLPGDTPDSVAANLAALVSQVRGASNTGATISIPGATRLVVRVVADQPAMMATRRQSAKFRLACWCPDPITRDTAASVIDAALAVTPFFPLPDGSAGRLQYVGSETSDDLAAMPLYRRELTYTVIYPTTLTQIQPSMLFGIFGVVGPSGIDELQLA